MKEIELAPSRPGETIATMLQRAGASFELPCAGNHTCGKCKIAARGELDPPSPSEAVVLGAHDMAAGLRMACFAKATGPVTVLLPERGGGQILTDGRGRLEARRPMMAEGRHGAAIDIGTTTVVCKIYDASGDELATVSELNAQRRFGADVISRIDYGIRHGNEDVHASIVGQLEGMLDRAAREAGIDRASVTHAVATGNTTMLHFLCGLDPKGIGYVPFTPQSLFGVEREDALRGIHLYVPPCVSAYVGADLVCCVLASGMMGRADTALIVDIGTNGEMALLHRGVLHACSTAAGPAFEGAGIHSGMTATAGAISHVRWHDDGLAFDTIDDAHAVGICGSGVLDVIAVLLERGAIRPSGLLEPLDDGPLASLIANHEEEGAELTFPGTQVVLKQSDVRQVQLAKAAIYAGMITLADACALPMDQIDVLYVCGGFGSFLDLASAEVIGLIPRGLGARTVVLGNGAITGAAMLLLDREARTEVEAIASGCRHIELSDSAEFMDAYVGSMPFGDMDEG